MDSRLRGNDELRGRIVGVQRRARKPLWHIPDRSPGHAFVPMTNGGGNANAGPADSCFAKTSFFRTDGSPVGLDDAGLLGMVGEFVGIVFTLSVRDGVVDVSNFGTCVRLFALVLPRFNGAAIGLGYFDGSDASDPHPSMGPRLLGRGYEHREVDRAKRSGNNSFNGAATSRSRIFLKRGAGQPSFNGAATPRSRIFPGITSSDRRWHGPSMGPRLLGRGYRIPSGVDLVVTFEPSMGPRLLGRGYVIPSTTWLLLASCLQWGRDF